MKRYMKFSPDFSDDVVDIGVGSLSRQFERKDQPFEVTAQELDQFMTTRVFDVDEEAETQAARIAAEEEEARLAAEKEAQQQASATTTDAASQSGRRVLRKALEPTVSRKTARD